MAAVSGPKFAPHSMQKILDKLDNRLNSLHYDTYHLKRHIDKVQAPIHRKFDKYFQEKVNFGGQVTCGAYSHRDRYGKKAFRLKNG